MLRNRSRAVTSKQALMADLNSSLLSPTKNPSTKISSFLVSPRFFSSKSISDSETAAMSPTSILDTKSSTSLVNPFGFDRNLSKITSTPSSELSANQKTEPEAIGLALIDSIIGTETDGNFSKSVNRMALFGSKLKVQIPTINPPSSVSPSESPKSPADFGIKTRSSQPFSPFPRTPSKDLCRQLSLKEMEMSEDYTCVIIRGPNPKTTHIFDDCVVESCCEHDIHDLDHEKMDYGFQPDSPASPPLNFLSFCDNCKHRLDQGEDIYMYRGEKAFCSNECRCQAMLYDYEGMKNVF